ncbi:MAG: non-canonical purine NTP pyrophosphatase [Candidatus Liptonbacteria bacterium]|nr:non-canonical purine NTP pyrophosphatase [Candidatus Liptonbacteria bacterium]
MKSLLIATLNPGKLKEIETVYANSGITLKNLKDFSEVPLVEETGVTFEENAILKAKYYFEKTGLPTLGDDGGLMVDALGGEPGVKSHRFLGYNANEVELAEAIIERLKDTPKEKRTAHLGGVIAFWDGEHLIQTENFVAGYIVEELKEKPSPGFPYRAILFIPEFNKIYQDFTQEEYAKINHRYQNLISLKPEIIKHLSGKS